MKTLLSGVTTHPCRGRRNHSRDSASSEPTIQCSTSQASSHETTVTTEILAVGRTLRKAPAWRILSVLLTAACLSSWYGVNTTKCICKILSLPSFQFHQQVLGYNLADADIMHTAIACCHRYITGSFLWNYRPCDSYANMPVSSMPSDGQIL